MHARGLVTGLGSVAGACWGRKFSAHPQPCWRRDRASPGDRESCQGRHEGPDVQFLEKPHSEQHRGTSCVTAMQEGHETPGRQRASGHDRPHTDTVPGGEGPTPAGIRPATQQQAAGRPEEWGGHARGHAQLGRRQQHKGHKTRCTRWTDLQAEVVKSRPSEICPVAASLGPLGLELCADDQSPTP